MLGEMTFSKRVAEFQTRHPALAIDVTLNDRFVDPMTEGVDLSIRIGETGSGKFIARRLGTLRRLLLVIERHGIAARTCGARGTPLHPLRRFCGGGAAASDRSRWRADRSAHPHHMARQPLEAANGGRAGGKGE
jgi:DNA-binding transcriptional LysR family regulator